MPRSYEERLILSVMGSRQLEDLALRLKQAGNLTLRRRMLAALRKSGQQMADAEKAAARALPAEKYEVGLREQIADAVTVRSQTSAGRARVRVMVNRSKLPEGKGHLPVLMNRGAWRHPVFADPDAVHVKYGDQWRWVEQTSEAGWWTTTADAESDNAQDQMLKVLRETAAQITGD